MKISINKLIILNFKGIRSKEISFGHRTDISGDNGLCKTTIFDAFTWLLFGKDGRDEKDFNIKTLDENNNPIPQIDHSVAGILTMDGQELTLSRTFREKWTRRRGSEDAELTGHETTFTINEVPVSATEFKDKISSIVLEDLFKLITSPTYFNSLPWKQRREILVGMAGKIDVEDVKLSLDASKREQIDYILSTGKKIAEYKREAAERRKKLKEALKLIPSRIDEVRRTIPEQEPDYKQLQDRIDYHTKQIESLGSKITDQVTAYNEKADEVRRTQGEITKLRGQQQAIIMESDRLYRQAVSDATQESDRLTNENRIVSSRIASHESEAEAVSVRITSITKKIEELRGEYVKVADEQILFDEAKFACPTCKRAYAAENVAQQKKQMAENFEADKSKRLIAINEEGKKYAAMLAELETQLSVINTTLAGERKALSELQLRLPAEVCVPSKPDATKLPEYLALQEGIDKLQEFVKEIPPVNVDELRMQITELQQQVAGDRSILTRAESIATAKARIEELMGEEKSLAQQLSDIERKEFACEAFTNAYMDLVERRVNGKFSLVRFKMWNTLINGATEETCECMVNGVPYPDVNSAGKIQAGIDIINTMSKHYNVSAPIFVDNAETVNTLPEVDSQLIRLIVTRDQSLIITKNGE